MDWISTKNSLPKDKEIVLVFDGQINVAEFRTGISMEDRRRMKRGEIDDPIRILWAPDRGYFDAKRSDLFSGEDEQGNNKVPYCWVAQSGPKKWFGQHISHWMPLPDPPPKPLSL